MPSPESFMKHALRRAETAARHGETPVGAVIVRDGKIIAGGRNKREGAKNALRHAELDAIDAACRKLGGWRLIGCDLYVTLEPCPMCAGAIILSRIEHVYFGTYDKKAGSFGSLADFNTFGYNHKPEVTGGVLEEECAALLSGFFKDLRRRKALSRSPKTEEEPHETVF